MERIVRDLLLLAGIEAVREPGTAVDLDEVVANEMARARALAPGVEWSAVLLPVEIEGRPGELSRLAANLLEKAVRYAVERVTVELTVRGDAARLVVADDGPGIAPSDRERVFESFTRVDGARRRSHGGAGLGLAIVREIAAAHGGVVAVDDGPNGGTRFTVELPGVVDAGQFRAGPPAGPGNW
ncbi:MULTISPECIES: cell wall metabolism sensor histidine kinase WalK [unclassified Nocardia]|uniref:sensor histidine kinase n=1 Tax=unclassified Nocardia TaxID=2637762 RepID=UPI00278C5791|nr:MULTISPECIES: ATP-binding protein [unclassified Nocardia]